MEILKRLAEKHPKGLLFRNSKGKIWTSHDATRRLHYATRKLGIPKGTVYAVRHKFISDGLEKGLNANVIAELCGNSPLTISRNYDHLSSRKAAMKEAALRAVS
jgi:site-specific recombinase XerD